MTGMNFTPKYGLDAPWLQQKTMVMPTFSAMPTGGFGNRGYSGWNSGWNNSSWRNQSSGTSATVSQNSSAKKTLNLTKKEEAILKKEQKGLLGQQNKAAHGSLGTNIAMGSVFCLGAVKNGVQVKKNAGAVEMFFEYDNVAKKAKYEKLWKDAPIAMKDAQEQMAKAHRKYLSEYKRLVKKGLSTAALDDDYLKLAMRMEKALNSGTAQEVAEATERLRSANSISYKKLAKLNKKKRYTVTKETLARKANVSKVKAVKGNKLLSHAGGKLGVGMGLASGALILGADYSKIKEAYKIDSETGNKQLAQSGTKAIGVTVGYTAGDAIGRKLATKALSKGVSKIAAKVAAKGAGKLVGMAIGSIVPGIGTIAGLVIGTVADYAISKWVIPAFWGDNDVVDNKKIDKQTQKDTLKEAYINYKNGAEVSQDTIKILQNNAEFCAKIEEEIQKANAA